MVLNGLTIGCDGALGMRSGRIRDRQVKGSSFTSNWANSKPANARLHKTGGWCVYSMEHMSVKSPYRLYAMNDTLGMCYLHKVDK